MFYLIPHHTIPGKKEVIITIFSPDKIMGYNLRKEPFSDGGFLDGNSFSITENGIYFLTVQMSNLNTEHTTFTISFLQKKPKFDSGDGTESSPYLISTIDQLNLVRLHLGAYFRLTQDIDLSQWGIEWSPIGEYVALRESLNVQKAFTGVFDGNNHRISNLSCKIERTFKKDPQRSHKLTLIGLFGCAFHASIKNLVLSSCTLYGEMGGCLIGEAQECLVQNCHAQGYIETTLDACGLSGNGDRSSFIECSFSGKVLSKFSATGLCAMADNVIDCEISADIGALRPSGICNIIVSSIQSCIIRGTISGCFDISGMSGSFINTKSKIMSCICALSFLKKEQKDIFPGFHSEHIITSPHDHVFSIIDRAQSLGKNHQNNFYLDTLEFIGHKKWSNGKRRDGVKISKEQLCDQQFLESISWDFNTIWIMGPDGPHLLNNPHF